MIDTMLLFVTLTIFPFAMILAALSDLLTMNVSNKLTLGLVPAFLVVAVISGMSIEAMAIHVAVGLGTFVIAFALFALGWIGGGDAKLITATALWLGPWPFGHYLFLSAIVGCVLTVALLIFRGVPLPQWAEEKRWITRLHHAGRGAPYCVALAIGGLATYPSSDLFALAIAR